MPPARLTRPWESSDGSVITTEERFHAHRHRKYLECDARVSRLGQEFAAVDALIREHLSEQAAVNRAAARERLLHAVVMGEARPDEPEQENGVDELYRERILLGDARTLAMKELGEAEKEASAEIIEMVRPAYLELNRAIVAALAVLSPLVKAERSLRRAMLEGGTHVDIMQPLGVPGFDPDQAIKSIQEDMVRFHRCKPDAAEK
jgi:hypothetical protein